MKIQIKNMVCSRCKMVVNSIFEKLNLHPTHIELGEIYLKENDISSLQKQLAQELRFYGFEILNDKKTQIIEKIKNKIIEIVQVHNGCLRTTLSEYLKQELNQDYSALSNLFSEVEDITIEKYFILQKIEKVKELLIYNELTLSEIAYQLNYSSTAYLSNQFKKVTGITPSHFKKMETLRRNSLDKL